MRDRRTLGAERLQQAAEGSSEDLLERETNSKPSGEEKTKNAKE